MAESTEGAKAPRKKRSQSPQRKAARAMAKAETLSAAGAAAMAELSGLQRLVGALVQGVSAIQDAQATQTEMLLKLMAAVVVPTESDDSVADALRRISAQLDEQSRQARETQSVLVRLPDAVAAAIGREMTAALDAVR